MSMRFFLKQTVFPIVVGVVIFIPILGCLLFLSVVVEYTMPIPLGYSAKNILIKVIIPFGLFAVWFGIMRYIFGSSVEGTTSFSRFVHVLFLGFIGIVVGVLVQLIGFIVDAVLLYVFQQRSSHAIISGICTAAEVLVWGYSMYKLFVFTRRDRQA